MAVIFECQTIIECDNCGEYVGRMLHTQEAKEAARNDGWTIGKTVNCPNCVEAKKIKVLEKNGWGRI